MRDRYLFSADRKASEYKHVLEITLGHARLLTPSYSARHVRWIVSIGLAVAYYSLVSFLMVPLLAALSLAGSAPAVAWTVIVVLFGVLFGGFFVLFFWWDRRSLPLLADAPSGWMELILLGARSFGTFQDVRAKTVAGEEMHLVVDARSPRFWEAVELLEGKAPTSA